MKVQSKYEKEANDEEKKRNDGIAGEPDINERSTK